MGDKVGENGGAARRRFLAIREKPQGVQTPPSRAKVKRRKIGELVKTAARCNGIYVNVRDGDVATIVAMVRESGACGGVCVSRLPN